MFTNCAQATGDSPPMLTGLECIFGNILTAAIPLAAIVLFIFLMMGGIKYITSADNPEKAAGAKNTLTWAIYGMIFLALAYLFIRILGSFIGVDIGTFKIRQ